MYKRTEIPFFCADRRATSDNEPRWAMQHPDKKNPRSLLMARYWDSIPLPTILFWLCRTAKLNLALREKVWLLRNKSTTVPMSTQHAIGPVVHSRTQVESRLAEFLLEKQIFERCSQCGSPQPTRGIRLQLLFGRSSGSPVHYAFKTSSLRKGLRTIFFVPTQRAS